MKVLYYKMLQYQQKNLKLLKDNFEIVELETLEDDTDKILREIEIGFAPLGFNYDRKKIDKMPKLKVIASNTTGEPHISGSTYDAWEETEQRTINQIFKHLSSTLK